MAGFKRYFFSSLIEKLVLVVSDGGLGGDIYDQMLKCIVPVNDHFDK